MNYLTEALGRTQREPLPGQVPNDAGGYVYGVDEWTRLRRFLILGSEGGTYYATERALTIDNAEVVNRCIAQDGQRTVAEIVAISTAGRNPKQGPVLFALAACAGAPNEATRKAALGALPQVARTGSHLLMFVSFVQGFRGWGRALRRAVAAWYTDADPDRLAYQMVKYAQRDGWSQRDVLRLAKPRPERGSATDAVLRFAVGKADVLPESSPQILRDQRAAAGMDVDALASFVPVTRLPWEALPSEALGSGRVWRAMLGSLPMGALVRNLGRMTANGALSDADAIALVEQRLTDPDRILRARLHPIAVLSAMATYRNGRGTRGSLTWDPHPAVIDALDAAFEASFGTVEPTGKRLLLGLDVSGSMGWGTIAGVPRLTPREAAAAMAVVALRTEADVRTIAFTSAGRGHWAPERARGPYGLGVGMAPLALSARQRVDDVVALTGRLPFGGTDCALPMRYALARGLAVDAFVIYTDNETWAGDVHPVDALRDYRRATGIGARLVVVGLTATGFSIADPTDQGMLDVVGFDTAAPQVMADFIAGR